MEKTKPKVAFFDISCCEGCQLQLLNIDDSLLDILAQVEVVNFREIASENGQDYDIAFLEGSVTNDHDARRVLEIREKAKILVAYGACATIGGINGVKNTRPLDEVRREVYGEFADCFETGPNRSIDQVVAVDYHVNGCPIYPPELLKVFTRILQGLPYSVPDYAVCVECKLRENVCLYEKGKVCLGPITRAGCNAWCPSWGNTCYGCRGILTNPAEQGQLDVLKKHGVSDSVIFDKMTLYYKCQKEGARGR
jgi:coenzyme F420-reducing hydrogenase gamma subunit